MEVEQFEMDEIENNNKLSQPIFKKKNSKKTKKTSISKKLIVGAIFAITLIAFIFLNYINNKNINISQTIEKNEKEENKLSIEENNGCEVGYKLIGDKCVINYSFKATYKTFQNDEIITLQRLFKSDKLKEMLVNGKPTRPSHKFLCSEKGDYTFHVLLKEDAIIEDLTGMFDQIIYLQSIYFSELFNTEKVTKMTNMFRNCKSLKVIDISKFNTKNVQRMDFMFFGCHDLTTLDLSNLRNDNLINLNHIFQNCKGLLSINLTNFKK